MLIMPHPYGRLANLLILAITFIAQAEEQGDSFLHLTDADFRGFDFLVVTDHPVEDNYALSTYDYMIEPPSTYTAWASFYGDTPKHFIQSAQEVITLDAFDIQQSI